MFHKALCDYSRVFIYNFQTIRNDLEKNIMMKMVF